MLTQIDIDLNANQHVKSSRYDLHFLQDHPNAATMTENIKDILKMNDTNNFLFSAGNDDESPVRFDKSGIDE